MIKKLAAVLSAIALICTAGCFVYRIHFIPKSYPGTSVYYKGALLEYKNLVARKNDATGLRLEYIGTVNSVSPKTETPNIDFECSNKHFLKATLYRDIYGVFYLYCTNGDLLMLKPAGAGWEVRIPPFSVLSHDSSLKDGQQ